MGSRLTPDGLHPAAFSTGGSHIHLRRQMAAALAQSECIDWAEFPESTAFGLLKPKAATPIQLSISELGARIANQAAITRTLRN